MNRFAIILVLSALPSCSALDKLVGAGESAETSEVKIAAIESGARTAGDMPIPGAGGLLAILAGLGARKYVKSRKPRAAPVDVV